MQFIQHYESHVYQQMVMTTTSKIEHEIYRANTERDDFSRELNRLQESQARSRGPDFTIKDRMNEQIDQVNNLTVKLAHLEKIRDDIVKAFKESQSVLAREQVPALEDLGQDRDYLAATAVDECPTGEE